VSDEAFRQHASGLFVPSEHSRDREVWTSAEWKQVNRAIKFLRSKGVVLQLRCPQCTGKMTEHMVSGHTVLRCEHKDRIMARHV
jgi:hypothetical protein